jgi:hypothetical protein
MNPSNLDRYKLLAQGVLLERATQKGELATFINSLRPRDTNLPLVRLGGWSDGGYLVPDDLRGISACFSPGVSNLANFEKDLYDRYAIKSHLADYSVDAPPSDLQYASFEKKFIGACFSSKSITLNQWVNKYESTDNSLDLILQMDIEGDEYEVLLSASAEVLRRFRVMVIEFHNIESYAHQNFFKIVSGMFSKILSAHYLVHIHPNNCCGVVNLSGVDMPRVLEMTFLRKDRCLLRGLRQDFPHALDRPNIDGRPDLPLPRSWLEPLTEQNQK